jgi:hypothetical protein
MIRQYLYIIWHNTAIYWHFINADIDGIIRILYHKNNRIWQRKKEELL